MKIKFISVFKIIKDIKNYFIWIKIIKKEKNNKKSKWHDLKLNHNLFYNIYVQYSLPEETAQLNEDTQRLVLVDNLKDIHRYLDNDLKFAEYIIPEFNRFYDNNNEPTLTFAIVYRFAFKYFSLKWVLKRILILSILILIYKFDLINNLITWFNNLM